MSDSHVNDPKHWRDRAKETRSFAERTNEAGARETILRIAADYERLVSRAGERLGGSSTSNGGLASRFNKKG